MKIQPHCHFLTNVMATEAISKVHLFLSCPCGAHMGS